MCRDSYTLSSFCTDRTTEAATLKKVVSVPAAPANSFKPAATSTVAPVPEKQHVFVPPTTVPPKPVSAKTTPEVATTADVAPIISARSSPEGKAAPAKRTSSQAEDLVEAPAPPRKQSDVALIAAETIESLAQADKTDNTFDGKTKVFSFQQDGSKQA